MTEKKSVLKRCDSDRIHVVDIQVSPHVHADVQQLQALIRGRLGQEEKLQLMEQIGGCDECAGRLADCFGIGGKSAQEVRPLRTPPGFEQAVRKRIEQEHCKKNRRKAEFLRYSARVSAAACAALMLLFSQMWATLNGNEMFSGMEWNPPGIINSSIERTTKLTEDFRAFSDRMVNWEERRND